MTAKPFWSEALTGRKSTADVVTMPMVDEASDSPGGGSRKALVLVVLAVGALALGYVPAVDDGSPRRGAFPLPPATSSEASKGQPVKGRPTEAVASEPIAEANPPAAAQEQTLPDPSNPVSEEPSTALDETPPVDTTPVLQVPVVPQLVEDVNSLVSELPVPVDSVAG